MNNLNIPKPPQSGCPLLALSVADAAKAVGLGRGTLYANIKDGSLKSIKVGSRRLITVEELTAFLGRLAAEQVAA
jgi:excisionase family DNA binding protein